MIQPTGPMQSKNSVASKFFILVSSVYLLIQSMNMSSQPIGPQANKYKYAI